MTADTPAVTGWLLDEDGPYLRWLSAVHFGQGTPTSFSLAVGGPRGTGRTAFFRALAQAGTVRLPRLPGTLRTAYLDPYAAASAQQPDQVFRLLARTLGLPVTGSRPSTADELISEFYAHVESDPQEPSRVLLVVDDFFKAVLPAPGSTSGRLNMTALEDVITTLNEQAADEDESMPHLTLVLPHGMPNTHVLAKWSALAARSNVALPRFSGVIERLTVSEALPAPTLKQAQDLAVRLGAAPAVARELAVYVGGWFWLLARGGALLSGTPQVAALSPEHKRALAEEARAYTRERALEFDASAAEFADESEASERQLSLRLEEFGQALASGTQEAKAAARWLPTGYPPDTGLAPVLTQGVRAPRYLLVDVENVAIRGRELLLEKVPSATPRAAHAALRGPLWVALVGLAKSVGVPVSNIVLFNITAERAPDRVNAERAALPAGLRDWAGSAQPQVVAPAFANRGADDHALVAWLTGMLAETPDARVLVVSNDADFTAGVDLGNHLSTGYTVVAAWGPVPANIRHDAAAYARRGVHLGFIERGLVDGARLGGAALNLQRLAADLT